MKKLIFIALLAVCATLATAKTPPKNTFTINGDIKNIPDTTEIEFLMPTIGRTLDEYQIVTAINGKFSITDTITKQKELNIAIYGNGFPSSLARLWVAPGVTVKITGDGKMFTHWDYNSPLANQAKEKKYNDATRELQKSANSFYSEYMRLAYFEKTKNDSTLKLAKKYFGSFDSIGSLMTLVDMTTLENDTRDDYWRDKFRTMAQSSSNGNSPCHDRLIALYGSLKSSEKRSDWGKEVYIFLYPEEKLKIGDQIRDAELFDLGGNKHQLSEYTDKGKYILLDFWSSGCGPCRMAARELGEVADSLSSQLTMISISQDSKELWEAASKQDNIRWENLNDLKGETGIFARYRINGIPQYMIFDPTGKLVSEWFGYGDGIIKAKLAEVMK